MANGHLGQYVYVNPDKQMVIVRLGKSSGEMSNKNWKELFTFLSKQIL